MRELKYRTKLLITLTLAIGTVTSFFSNDAIAGTRRCQIYSDNTGVCINEKGYKTYCRIEKGNGYNGTKDVCVGKGNYRKECIPITNLMSSCIDSKGIKSRCQTYGTSGISYCKKSDGTENKCVHYDRGYSVCNDIDKKGNPI
jgi:hypothetical protein